MRQSARCIRIGAMALAMLYHDWAVGDGPGHYRLGRRNGQGRARRGRARRDRDAHQRNQRHRRSAPAVTNATGDFQFPVTPVDTYTVEITMPLLQDVEAVRRRGEPRIADGRSGRWSWKSAARPRRSTSRPRTPLIQATSGERSFTVPTDSVQNLPFANRGFTSLASLAPGVDGTTDAGAGHAAAACRATS